LIELRRERLDLYSCKKKRAQYHFRLSMEVSELIEEIVKRKKKLVIALT
jgi:hypothetical protein